jgi:hypothetical protein
MTPSFLAINSLVALDGTADRADNLVSSTRQKAVFDTKTQSYGVKGRFTNSGAVRGAGA